MDIYKKENQFYYKSKGRIGLAKTEPHLFKLADIAL